MNTQEDFPSIDNYWGMAAEATCWIASAISLMCCFHVLLNATFASVWGRMLALRGGAGSVSKAFFGMRLALSHINKAYIGALGFFFLECISAFGLLQVRSNRNWQLEWVPYTSITILVVGVGVCWSYYEQIKTDLYDEGGKAWELSRSARKKHRDFDKEDNTLFRRNSFDDDDFDETQPLTGGGISVNPHGSSLHGKRGRAGGGRSAAIDHLGGRSNYEGYLERRYLMTWARRYFVLQGSTLSWWRTQAAADAARVKSKTGPWSDAEKIVLREFQVFVSRNDGNSFEFIMKLSTNAAVGRVATQEGSDAASDTRSNPGTSTLYGSGGSKKSVREKHYRAPSDDERREWVRVLVALSVSNVSDED